MEVLFATRVIIGLLQIGAMVLVRNLYLSTIILITLIISMEVILVM